MSDLKPMSSRREIKLDAWILDVQVHRDGIMVWFISKKGTGFRALYDYNPSFFAVLSDDSSPLKKTKKELYRNRFQPLRERYTLIKKSLGSHAGISSLEITEKRVHAEDVLHRPVLNVSVTSPFLFKKVLKDLKNLEKFTFYNTDLPIAQKFFYETGLFPFALCSVKIEKKAPHRRNHIRSISLKDTNTAIDYPFPPLKIVWLDIEACQEGMGRMKTDPLERCTLTMDPFSEPLQFAQLFHPSLIREVDGKTTQLVLNEGRELETLHMLEKSIKRIDPDIIFTKHGDEDIFPYLLARLSYHNMAHKFTLSRDGTPLRHTQFKVANDGENHNSFMSYGRIYHRASSQFYLNGRLHIDSSIYGGLHFEDGNIYGIVEVARVSYVPLQRLTRITIGGALQSLQFYHAFKQGVLIAEEKRNSEFFRSGNALLYSDRGGHIIQPKVGMFKRVAELDFTSMYPSLMVHYNVSPETLNCPCCQKEGISVPGLDYHICQKRKGIVPMSISLPLRKRIQYKKRAKELKHKDKGRSLRYQKMEGALKWILVVCFGYLGFRNARFGRIEAHQTVCAYARSFLLSAMHTIESYGLKAIHGIVDSLYVQAPPEMKTRTFHNLCKQVSKEIFDNTNIPISYSPKEEYFEVISFLPTKANPTVGALNRYWGMRPSGTMKVRGVEMRRHDAPPLIKEFQMKAIERLAQFMKRECPTSFVQDKEGIRDPRVQKRQNVKEMLLMDGEGGMESAIIAFMIPLLKNYYSLLESNRVKKKKLFITIRLTRKPDQYKVDNYQSIAASCLEREGIEIGPGEKVSFIITNDNANHPFNRVVPFALYNENKHNYDVFKYKELLVRALTNLFPFYVSDEVKITLQKISGGGSSGKNNQKRLVQKTLV